MIATDLDGRTWSLADLRGKVVLIPLWASWCEPCLAEMPTLQALAHRHGPQRLVVLAVNYAHDLALPNAKGARLGFFMYPTAESAAGRLDSYAPDDFRYQLSAREIKA